MPSSGRVRTVLGLLIYGVVVAFIAGTFVAYNNSSAVSTSASYAGAAAEIVPDDLSERRQSKIMERRRFRKQYKTNTGLDDEMQAFVADDDDDDADDGDDDRISANGQPQQQSGAVARDMSRPVRSRRRNKPSRRRAGANEGSDGTEDDISEDAIHELLHAGGDGSFHAFKKAPSEPFVLWMMPDPHSDNNQCVTRMDSSGVMTLYNCEPNHTNQKFTMSSDGYLGFEMPGRGHYCLHPDRRGLQPGSSSTAALESRQILSSLCALVGGNSPVDQESGKSVVDTWELRPGVGLVHVQSGLCATYDWARGVILLPCGLNPKAQAFFRARYNGTDIKPLNFEDWVRAWVVQRQKALPPVQKELARVADITSKNIPGPPASKDGVRVSGPRGRRVVVFFMDAKHREIVLQLKWWLFAWRQLQLDAPEQRFDVFIMGGGKSFEYLASQGCKMQTLEPAPSIPGLNDRGVCWLFPFKGIHEREPAKYDGWFNSIEVLINPKVKPLLLQYDQLLRADADTLPTPSMRGFWRDNVYMGENAGYATDYADSKLALAARAGGLNYIGHRNVPSTYYGPTKEVLRMAELTIAVGTYIRVFLFSPGSGCRLPRMLRPAGVDCEWGSGLWEGVALLYSQQMSVNHLLSKGMSITFGTIMDQTTTLQMDICTIHMLHVRHNADRFSKFALQSGKYKAFDMAELDIRYARDYMTYCALTANEQGINGEKALAKAGGDLSKICDKK